MPKDIKKATNTELAGVLNVTPVGLDTRVNHGKTVTIDENTSVITKEQQDFLRLVLREASRATLRIGRCKLKRYTLGQLEAILGVGKWWSMATASARLGNISQSDFRDLMFSLPRGVNGVFIEESEIFKGNEDFMLVGTLKDRIRRLKTWRTRLVFELRKPVMQDYPFLMRNTREKISQIDKTLQEVCNDAISEIQA